MRRRCDKCSGPLGGKRNHGFVYRIDVIRCGECEYPRQYKPWWEKIKKWETEKLDREERKPALEYGSTGNGLGYK